MVVDRPLAEHFLDTLLSLDALRHLGLYSIRNQPFAQINDRLLLTLAKNGLRSLTHTCDINKDHVTGDISCRGIIKFLTFDDAQRSMTVKYPRLSPSFLSELIEAVKSGRIARSDPPRKVLELQYAAETVDISTLSQYNSQTDEIRSPYRTKYFIDDNIKLEHYHCGQPFIQFFA